MAKKLSESRLDMPPVKKEKIAEVLPEGNSGKLVAITTLEKGCDITLRVGQSPENFNLGEIIKISK